MSTFSALGLFAVEWPNVTITSARTAWPDDRCKTVLSKVAAKSSVTVAPGAIPCSGTSENTVFAFASMNSSGPDAVFSANTVTFSELALGSILHDVAASS
jgi:hypothetical protein